MLRSATTTAVLVAFAAAGLVAGLIAYGIGAVPVAHIAWIVGTVPVLAALLAMIVSSLSRGEIGLDIIAAAAMAGSLVLGEYLAGIVIALMFAGGQGLEAYAEGRARREMSALLARVPRTAHRLLDGEITPIAVPDIQPGDHLLIRAGEVVPVDGTVVEPSGAVLDESALTGEPLPVRHACGSYIMSGTANAEAPFAMQATRTAAASTYAGIVRLVESAQQSKAPMARLAEKWAMAFLLLTAALAGAAWALTGDPVRALAVLVVATPCPLILAVPVAVVSGMSRAAKRGALVKSARAIETLAKAQVLLFDKTGTLTEGRARLAAVVTAPEHDASELLRLTASLAQASQHALSESVVESAHARGLVLTLPTATQEHPGAGLDGRVEHHNVALGTFDFITARAVTDGEVDALLRRVERDDASTMFVAIDGRMAGALVLADEIRPDAARVIRTLRAAGINWIGLVTGDRQSVAAAVGAALGVDEVHATASPEGKVAAVDAARKRGVTVMVGDGINDAPALAAADVGIAMGARGAAASSQAADIVLLVDRIDRLVDAMMIARRTRAIATTSAAAGIGLSLVAMVVAAFGYLPPVAGALVQEVIDTVVVLNALRALAPGGTIRPASKTIPASEAAALADEHRELQAILDQIRAVADSLYGPPSPSEHEALLQLDAALSENIVPHEQHDDQTLYPRVGRLIGGDDPMAAMSRSHREIFSFVRTLHRMIGDIPPQGPEVASARELQRLLYGLEAMLRLHFAQEDEIYQALADTRPVAPYAVRAPAA